MRVKVGKRIYQMSRKEAEGMLKIASEQVPRGIYAVQYKDYIELRCDRLSVSQMKKQRLSYRRQGMRVYCNGL